MSLDWEALTGIIAAVGVVVGGIVKCVSSCYKGTKVEIKTIKAIISGFTIICTKIKIWKNKK